MNRIKNLPYAEIIIISVGLILAIALRASLVDFKSYDYLKYTHVWYNTLKSEGFKVFATDFSNYNLPYLYLLYIVIRFFRDVPAPVAVKIPSLIADFISAWFVYRIVRLKYPESPFAILAAFAVLFAPTVVLNSAFWGQADALYTSALIATVYFLIDKKHIPTMLAFGIAVSFKAQAIFLSPLLLGLLLKREVPWKYFFIIPFVMLIGLLPALIAGRPFLDLLLIYPSQADQYQQLTMHAPSVFALIPDSSQTYKYFYPIGLMITALIGLCFAIIISKSRAKLSARLLLELALASVMLMPFLLPKMHERYFYPADVISIAFAFFVPDFYFVAIAMLTISFFAYQPFLFAQELVPLPILAIGLLILISIVLYNTGKNLYLPEPETAQENA